MLRGRLVIEMALLRRLLTGQSPDAACEKPGAD